MGRLANTQNNTLLKNAQVNANSFFLGKYYFLPPKKIFAIASIFYKIIFAHARANCKLDTTEIRM